MWQKQNELAMQAFVNGDSINAIRHWENAVAIAKEEALAPCPELAEIYYCLAKAQADSGDLRDAAENYQASVFQFEQSDPENQRLQSARYDLAQTLRKLNIDSDKATQLFQEALGSAGRMSGFKPGGINRRDKIAQFYGRARWNIS
ncbi:MAG: hypothetical protein R3C24_07625 [Cyanobacteriota/Melainabacteria group bacterium]